LEDAIHLADRVFVMCNRQATVQEIVEIVLPRERDLDAPGYLEEGDCVFSPHGDEPARR
jgi:ABC-type nitrate/sulfonate/bicarbonate transport system ATPase subunit